MRQAAFFLILLLLAGCDSSESDPPAEQPPPEAAPQTVGAVIERDEALGQFEDALIAGGFLDRLGGAGPFTVFAPTDDAFDLLDVPASDFTGEALAEALGLHIVEGSALLSDDIEEGDELITLGGDTLTVVRSGSGLGLDGDDPGLEADARILAFDLDAPNGVVHRISRVLTPYVAPPLPSLLELVRGNADLSYYERLVDFDGLDSLLASAGPLTLFAPNDDGITRLAESVGFTPDELVKLGLGGADAHIVPGVSLVASDLVPANEYPSADSFSSVCIVADGTGTLGVQSSDFDAPFAPIVGERVEARNGALFVIDGYLTSGSPGSDCTGTAPVPFP